MNLLNKTGSAGIFGSKDEFMEIAKKHNFIHTKISEAKVLVTDNLASTTGKMAKAEKMNSKNPGLIEVLSYEQFLDKYCKGYRPSALVQDTIKISLSKSAVKSLF